MAILGLGESTKEVHYTDGTFRHVVLRLKCQHKDGASVLTFKPRMYLNVARTNVCHLFCRVTNNNINNNKIIIFIIVGALSKSVDSCGLMSAIRRHLANAADTAPACRTNE